MSANEERELIDYYGQPIAPFLADSRVTEIMVNTFDEVWIERDGVLIRTEARWSADEDLVTFIRMIANRLGQERSLVERLSLDARLENGTRVNATLSPAAVRGACMSFRPYPKHVFGMGDLLHRGAITPAIAELLDLAVSARLNILIAGGTGSGKTTLLRAVCQSIPAQERVITIEGTHEHLLPDHPHRLYFEAPRRSQSSQAPALTVGTLIENALRQRPDRIVVGEVRTPEEAAALIDAMNTGHSGTLATIHANSAHDSLSRVEVLYARQALNFSMDIVRELVASNLDLVVYVSRDLEQGRATRRVRELIWLEDRQVINLIQFMRFRGYIESTSEVTRFRTLLSL
jgi:pilus assembly protein CpaF